MICKNGGNVYFFDSTALLYYARDLYKCFIKNEFNPNCLIHGENNVFVTDESSLEQAMESNYLIGIDLEFSDFIANNFTVISRDKATDALRTENANQKYHTGSVIIFENEPFAGVFGGLFYLYNVEKIEPVIVTFEPEVERVIKELGFTVYSE